MRLARRFTICGMAFRLIGDYTFGLDETNEMSLLGLGLFENGQSLFGVL